VTPEATSTSPPPHRPASGGRRTYVVACLAGNGIGPEVTAAASRALAQVSRQHGFRVEELHPPFDGEAVMQSGHPLPAATRDAARSADAVLVAGAAAPALEGVKAALDLAVRVTRVLAADGTATTFFAALSGASPDHALDRAFAAARADGGRITSVGAGPRWRRRVDLHADLHDGVDVRHLDGGDALELLRTGGEGLGVTVLEDDAAAAVEQAPRLARRPLLTATGFLSPGGPGLFAPTHGAAQDIAGAGVANPSGMLLASALLLGEGLGRRSAAQALEESLAATLAGERRTPDMAQAGVAATTREFVDAVLALLPSARRDTEFAMGVTR
jgi:3-isopropylmalate dehydrogenase